MLKKYLKLHYATIDPVLVFCVNLWDKDHMNPLRTYYYKELNYIQGNFYRAYCILLECLNHVFPDTPRALSDIA